MNIKLITITAKSHVYEELQKVFPKKGPVWISDKINAYTSNLEFQLIQSISNNPNNKLPTYKISTRKLSEAVGVVGNPPKRIYIHNEIMRVCPLFKKELKEHGFNELTTITLNTNNLDVMIASKTQLSQSISYTGIDMNEIEAKRLLGRDQTKELIEGLYPDLHTNPTEYEMIRINLKSIRSYNEWIHSPAYKGKDQNELNTACKLLVEIGQFFPYQDPTKHPDYTEYGTLPIKKFKSKFGREYYTSSIPNLNPQSMRKEFRKVVLGDNTTYDYDMQAFAITWMYGICKDFIETQTPGLNPKDEIPISEMIANGFRSNIINEIIDDVFVDRLVEDSDIRTFYYNQRWKYKKGESNEYILINGTLTCTRDYAMVLLKRAFNAIGFGATEGNKCWVTERVIKGERKQVFHGTALRQAFMMDKLITDQFVNHPLVQQFFNEMKMMTKIVMHQRYNDYIELKTDEDFYKNNKWNPNKVMAYLYQTAEFTIMEDIRAIIKYYQEKDWYNGQVLCNIHDGIVLSHHDEEMIDCINDEIRREYNNPYLTLVATKYKGFDSKHFIEIEKERYQEAKRIETQKSIGYKSSFVETGITVTPTMEEMLLDFYKQEGVE